ncbi:Thioredoxin domain-containing protein 17 [Halotydeus destructor]|nr:Thioredoxin domain-containing protein 17 [Halotydeus destructor]
MKQLSVEGYEGLLKVIDENKAKFSHLFILFTGNKDAAGHSWCPDCNVADPIIKKSLATNEAENAEEDAKSLLITSYVGELKPWKDQNNLFRKGKFSITSVPTLIKHGSPIKLKGSQLLDEQNITELFSE